MVRHSLRGEHPLGFIAVVEQYGPAAGTATRFDIVEDVADKPGLLQVNAMIAGSTKDKTRRGLAAVRMPSGSIRTVVSGVNQTIAKLPQHLRFDRAILIDREEAASDPALICDDDQFEPSRF